MTQGESNRPAEPAIREQLERILASAQFTNAESARKLLRFLVEETLAGRAQRIKEYTLATDVFGRDASFDPKIESNRTGRGEPPAAKTRVLLPHAGT